MSTCPRCSAATPSGAAFCSSCGARLGDPSETPTVAAPGGISLATPMRVAGGFQGARFAPGDVLGGRYRVVSRLGAGGMGEVYRAEDLRLGTTIALKLLSPGLAGSSGALARLHDEVRHAREVTHPNVCRVHDIAEADGVNFLTMEYVDGENLASLLRRIGRLPSDKAVEIARQICAGLAAAHDRGLLHRDLKPENVMIDGRGIVRLTDFGLAALEDRIRPEDFRSGTPAYMAPEQVEGREATVRSDLFALGLVLHEMVTGRRVFDARTPEDLDRQRKSFDPLVTTSGIGGVDPAVERIVRRCLDPDPARRPASARAVAAALPGGDPLAAALEAGETPSPELVAAAGADRAVSAKVAVAWLALFLAGMVAAPWLLSRNALVAKAGPVRSAEALAERARDVVARAAPDLPTPRDEARGFHAQPEISRWIEKERTEPDRWDLLASRRTGAIRFWYRASPRPLEARNALGIVSPGDPPPYLVSGSVGVALDEGGRLLEFHRVPSQVDPEAEGGPAAADWGPLLEAAGLSSATLRETPSRWVPPLYADARVAWAGEVPELPGIPFRIEAASYRGTPVHFSVLGPWARPARLEEAPPPDRLDRLRTNLNLVFVLVGIGFGVVFAWRNARLGRGDMRGATRMALVVLTVFSLGWAIRAHHQFGFVDEWDLFVRGTSIGLFLASLVWLLYLALEPLVRRNLPRTLISWTRLLGGGWRDPLVGRDVLIGAVAGAGAAVVVGLAEGIPIALGWDPGPPGFPSPVVLAGSRGAIAALLTASVGAILSPALILFLLAGLRRLVRRSWIAALGLFLVFVPLIGLDSGSLGLDLLLAAILVGIWVAVVLRVGLLALVSLFVVFQWLVTAPWSLDPSAWHFGLAALHGGAALVLAALAFSAALAGRPLLDAFDEAP